MTEPIFLEDLVVILAPAVVVVAPRRYLHVPSIAGSVVAGTVVVPNAS